MATDDDGGCLLGGCLLQFACIYDENAEYMIFTECDFTSCQVCTDATACNYVDGSTLDDGSCEYAEEGTDCNRDCLSEQKVSGTD